ncbi:hypothetical protein LVD15_09285 [Fulvivirga maritima]|uniref:hypothetical protein n=1 Tax=Fulvivirga maritima TaxID=2904247 RepID=UPI001F47809B|nr:hypothetical protein [Fulvivirga maritima]UII28598.1 hypothetical protein LVD15_09285 [Fulvivirga maritima]
METRVLSSSKVRYYIALNLSLWIVLLLTMIYISIKAETSTGFLLFNLAYFFLFFYKIFVLRTARLKSIRFNNHFLYIEERNCPIKLPLTEVRNVELRNFTGVHVIHLDRDFGFGKEIYFKTSLFYPFNYKRVNRDLYLFKKMVHNSKYEAPEEDSKWALAGHSV